MAQYVWTICKILQHESKRQIQGYWNHPCVCCQKWHMYVSICSPCRLLNTLLPPSSQTILARMGRNQIIKSGKQLFRHCRSFHQHWYSPLYIWTTIELAKLLFAPFIKIHISPLVRVGVAGALYTCWSWAFGMSLSTNLAVFF